MGICSQKYWINFVLELNTLALSEILRTIFFKFCEQNTANSAGDDDETKAVELSDTTIFFGEMLSLCTTIVDSILAKRSGCRYRVLRCLRHDKLDNNAEYDKHCFVFYHRKFTLIQKREWAIFLARRIRAKETVRSRGIFTSDRFQ
jgi:hypothetical protein